MRKDQKVTKNRAIWMIVLVLMTAGILNVRADEGMWIPMLLERYNIGMMQEAGLRLSAEDIYSINQDCLKDAIVIFGRGCTGEMVSADGLVLTNHHCGYGAIQRHSSVENDYLTSGFWAMSREEELPNEGLSVTFLRYMKDVTAAMEEGLVGGMDPDEVGEMVADAIRDDRFWILTHPRWAKTVQKQLEALVEDQSLIRA